MRFRFIKVIPVACFSVLSLVTISEGVAANLSSNTVINNTPHSVTSRVAGPCTLIDFEGIPDLAPIGVIAGTPTVTFGASWLGVIDLDAGGSGNFANEPTPNTIAFFLTPASPIDFSTGIQFVEVFYVASLSSVPVTLTAWAGPGGTGAIVTTAIGAVVGTSSDGAACVGDPNGTFCLWSAIQLASATKNIMSVTLTGAVANQFAFDNMTFCPNLPLTGACCHGAGALTCTVTTAANCTSLGGVYKGDGVACGPNTCDPIIPAVSEWGLAVLTLIGLVCGTILFGRRRAAVR